jgi:hypothetical protein
MIGLHRMPGSDHRNCVSPSQAFPLLSPSTSTGGTGRQKKLFQYRTIFLIPLSDQEGENRLSTYRNLPLFSQNIRAP